MIRYELLYENFIDEVKKKIPQNAKVSAVLADILLIEKEAVYRRLRKDVPFTFAEVAAVAKKLNISLDHIIDSDPFKSRPLQLKLVEYENPGEHDYVMLEFIPEILRNARVDKESEMGMCANMVPIPIYNMYENIARYFIFRWMYFSSEGSQVKKFSEVAVSERLRSVQIETAQELRKVKKTIYVLEPQLFYKMVNSIKYYASINLISENEVEILKSEMLKMIDEVEGMAARGCYRDTGCRVLMYISNVNFENSYLYFDAVGSKLSLIKAFILNGIATADDQTHEKTKKWINSLKRVSTLISESGEKERFIFFDNQRKMIAQL